MLSFLKQITIRHMFVQIDSLVILKTYNEFDMRSQTFSYFLLSSHSSKLKYDSKLSISASVPKRQQRKKVLRKIEKRKALILFELSLEEMKG